MVSAKYVAGIFSREHPDLYQWLVPILLTFSSIKDVRQVVISNNFSQFLQEADKCEFGILYHSKKRGRLNVTDVTDSLYDMELKHLNETYGRRKVLVVIDDLQDSSDQVKNEILRNQNSISELAQELFIFSTAEKALIDSNGYQSDPTNKLSLMRRIIEGKQGSSERTNLESWSENRRNPRPDLTSNQEARRVRSTGRQPGQQCGPMWLFIAAVIAVILILVIVLPLTLSH